MSKDTIREGQVNKGGRNPKPNVQRPSKPPQGQGQRNDTNSGDKK